MLRQRPIRGGRMVLACALLAFTASTDVARAGQDALPSGRTVVAKFVEAIGGEAAYRALQSLHATGRFEIATQGIAGDLEIFSARPSRLRYRVTVPGIGRIENGFDGTIGWSTNPISGPELLTGRQLTEARDEAWFDASLHLADQVNEVTTLERTEFDGHPSWKVKVVFVSGNEQIEYFDRTTGLQVGSEATRATPQGLVPTVNFFRNYRKFGAVLQATTFVQRALGFEQVVTIATVDYNSVADAVFDVPAEVKALVGR